MQAGWAYRRHYASDAERHAAFTVFLRGNNHARPHGGIGRAIPASPRQAVRAHPRGEAGARPLNR